jgi:RND family efflux transporter MFP subunit
MTLSYRQASAVCAALIYAPWCLVASAQMPPSNEPRSSFDCMIEAVQTVEIRSPAAGLIQRVHTRRGDTVKEGQLLVTIESSVERSASEAARFRAEAQGALAVARNKLAAAKDKAKRLESLFAEEFVSAQARDDAVAEMKASEAELKSAQESHELAQLEHRQSLDQLQRRQIRAPFTGVVVDQYLFPGALVDGGEGKKPILKIAQTHPLLVQALLPFQLFKKVRLGQRVKVTPEKPFGFAIAATVQTVDRVVDAAAGTFGIVAQLSNANQSLPAGIRCKLDLSEGP